LLHGSSNHPKCSGKQDRIAIAHRDALRFFISVFPLCFDSEQFEPTIWQRASLMKTKHNIASEGYWRSSRGKSAQLNVFSWLIPIGAPGKPTLERPVRMMCWPVRNAERPAVHDCSL
jgi:hypothetical protein